MSGRHKCKQERKTNAVFSHNTKYKKLKNMRRFFLYKKKKSEKNKEIYLKKQGKN